MRTQLSVELHDCNLLYLCHFLIENTYIKTDSIGLLYLIALVGTIDEKVTSLLPFLRS